MLHSGNYGIVWIHPSCQFYLSGIWQIFLCHRQLCCISRLLKVLENWPLASENGKALAVCSCLRLRFRCSSLWLYLFYLFIFLFCATHLLHSLLSCYNLTSFVNSLPLTPHLTCRPRHAIIYIDKHTHCKTFMVIFFFLFYSHQMSRYIILEKKLIFAKKL